jgi:hypothetical protein
MSVKDKRMIRLWAYMVILTASTVALLALGDREMLLVRAGKEKGAKT